MQLALPEPASAAPRGGSQQGRHAHRAPVGGVQGGGGVRRGLGHEHQVEVWGVGGVEEDLPQHGALRAHRWRRSAAGRKDTEKVMWPTDPVLVQPELHSKDDVLQAYMDIQIIGCKVK